MRATKVFEIVEMEATQRSGIVRGRAYEDVQVGDTVFVEGKNLQPLEYKIVGIITYQREVPLLNRMMTGQLTLEGANPQALRDASHLLKMS